MECIDIQKRKKGGSKTWGGSPCIERRIVDGKASHEFKLQGICLDDLE